MILPLHPPPSPRSTTLPTPLKPLIMADPLLTLRQAIAAGQAPSLSSTAEISSTPPSLAQANFLHFAKPNGQTLSYALDTPTRFVSSDAPVDLRSIYFA